ncbi:MarC family protein [Kaistia dalseonensis]|uniref:UPF0056 membrane protein n=1 Tax=Kaistia dalseonensis TaxID=410840 RepID=A0ABU0H249_9HYPH|nr:MarC family protein [Kaistia dalseonensis]MCX5493823.1 MarC family protein [Kaistia dalseonensis]MDQ0436388.1 multiple antibiotic resistance protein [Kaistia dalseonensis]
MLDYFLNALATLFVTLDPIGLAPIFIGLTRGMTSAQRHQTATRASLTAMAILFAFALGGQGLLTFLGISVPAFRIAGGLLLFWIAFEMVFERRDRRKQASADRALGETAVVDADDVRYLAIFPLAIPLISGPGAISATILLASSAPGTLGLIGLLIIVAALIGSCYLVFRLAGPLDRALGETGRIVLSRLLGVLLSALAVQFVADGVVAIARAAQAGGG